MSLSLSCQPELVEGGYILIKTLYLKTRLRQAQG